MAGFKAFAKKKHVPVHQYEVLYYTGGIAMFLFVLQFITGMVLSFYYIPYFSEAHKSIVEPPRDSCCWLGKRDFSRATVGTECQTVTLILWSNGTTITPSSRSRQRSH